MTRYDLFLIQDKDPDYRLDKDFNELKSLIKCDDIEFKEFITDNASLHYRGLSKGSVQLIGYFDNVCNDTTILPISRVGEDKTNGIILLNMNITVPNCLPSSVAPIAIESIADKINHAIEYFNNIINKLKTKENE